MEHSIVSRLQTFEGGYISLTLSSCVEDLNEAWLVIDNGMLPVRILDSWVVVFDEMIQAQLRVCARHPKTAVRSPRMRSRRQRAISKVVFQPRITLLSITCRLRSLSLLGLVGP